MTSVLEELKIASSALPPSQRMELAQFLLESLETKDEQQWKEAWAEELAVRLEEIQSGKVTGVPAEAVLSRLRERYP